MSATQPGTAAGREYLLRLERDDAGMQRLSSGRFHLGAITADAWEYVTRIEAEAAAAERERIRAALHASASRVIADGDEARAQAWVGIRKWADGIILALDLDAAAGGEQS